MYGQMWSQSNDKNKLRAIVDGYMKRYFNDIFYFRCKIDPINGDEYK